MAAGSGDRAASRGRVVSLSWQPELDERQRRLDFAMAMGGPERVARQHNAGRLTVRERIEQLLDPQSFQETGALAGAPTYDADGKLTHLLPANCVFGRGRVDGRRVVVSGDDFTVRGGSADAAIWEKMKVAETMAAELRLPLIRLIEGSGGGGSVRTIETKGRANLPGGIGGSGGLHLCTANLGQVPVVALALGSVAGLGAGRLVASHLSVMVRGQSAVFVAGPPVVAEFGEQRDKQELGGADIQLEAGAVDLAVGSETEAFEVARRFLAYLPSSVWDVPPRGRSVPVGSADEWLLQAVPRDARQPYMMRRVIGSVVDPSSFFEIAPQFGRPIITGLARLCGWPVALMAGDPLYGAGAWDAAACDKIVRLVDLAETFHLPIVHLVDCPGFRVGLKAEQSGAIRHGLRALAAINQTSVPWCSMLLRNVFGVGGGAHQPQSRLALRYAWPSASWGSLPLAGGVEAAYRAELDQAPDREARLAEISERLEALRSPFRTAEAFWVEDIIDPRDTRRLLCEFAELAAPLRHPGVAAFTMRP